MHDHSIRVRLTNAAGAMIGFLILPASARLSDLESHLRLLGAAHLEVLQ